MIPPADEPPDLGIPPNRGPLPVRRNPNSKPNPRVCSGHRRNARPGIPVWLHYVLGTVFRTNSEPFKYHMQKFMTLIVNIMKKEKLFASQGGPINLAHAIITLEAK
ncbi:hypothetical protein VitviT2T_024539 [Vitis vinifera]|uniref:beta-galactosidase n=1 Tax=Vitis vinifera TaxID=29760 RepID=A0ABY9DJR3_VITVI|nr:hypothetical protein VitviT2T_024539 [Vitis vinifera]